MILRAVIVDDEPLALTRLRRLLTAAGDVNVVGEATSAAEAARIAASEEPDVLFLDVMMPVVTGIELLRVLSPRPAIVFTTAHPRYAVEAFDENAVDFLLKPVSAERLERALIRVRQTLARRRANSATPPVTARIAVRKRSEVVFINPCDITWVAAEGNYCRIYANGSSYIVRQLIGDFSRRLDPGRFGRVHRSAIVNWERISRVIGSREDGYSLVLDDGTTIRIGGSYVETLDRLIADAL